MGLNSAENLLPAGLLSDILPRKSKQLYDLKRGRKRAWGKNMCILFAAQFEGGEG